MNRPGEGSVAAPRVAGWHEKETFTYMSPALGHIFLDKKQAPNLEMQDFNRFNCCKTQLFLRGIPVNRQALK